MLIKVIPRIIFLLSFDLFHPNIRPKSSQLLIISFPYICVKLFQGIGLKIHILLRLRVINY